jgi:hypothetical protein
MKEYAEIMKQLCNYIHFLRVFVKNAQTRPAGRAKPRPVFLRARSDPALPMIADAVTQDRAAP